ncbi:M1 family metallopeptidase [Pararhodonellum marinum]|uniref:M1 family metallopeptidase n=1 Tax=Pararhodonellum marinum TaxID=2755358 RepID=UPI00189076E4|nr:M1 family metallopeptidase [Pararhodonellum marinum]
MKRNYLLVLVLVALFLTQCQSKKNAISEVGKTQTPQVERVKPLAKTVDLVQREALIAQYRSTEERKFDLLHTSLDLRFDYEQKNVRGVAELTLKPFFYEQNILHLDAKDFEIHEISLLNPKEARELAFRYDQQKVEIYLPKTYTAKDTIHLKMRYTAYPEKGSGMGSQAITDNKGLYFVNTKGNDGLPDQIWTQGETEHNSKWYPTIDSPNERATQEIKLNVPNKYVTISNGIKVGQTGHADGSRTDHWKMELPHAPYLAAVVVGDFVKIEDQWEDIPLGYWVEPEFKEGAKLVFKNTPEMIGFFSELLDVRFPWPKYDQVVVRDFVSGAMENTTISVFMEGLNLNEREAIDHDWDGIIAHELFHQWFGNYVTTESWSHLPLNEAFANYSEYLWDEYKYGRDDADIGHVSEMEQYLAESEEKKEDLIRFYYDTPEDMFDSHSYAKGGRVLHMLRKYLGDEAFFEGLRLYLKQNAFSSVEIHDLRLAFEKVSGKDLNWFFNQWFLDAGHPILEVDFDMSEPDNILLTVAQRQDMASAPLYKLPFKVSWYKKGERFEKTFMLERGMDYFALENGPGTDMVLFDESLEVLSQKITYRDADHFKKQALESHFGIARYEALDSLSQHYQDEVQTLEALYAAMGDKFWANRNLALTRLSAFDDIQQLPDFWEEKIFQLAEYDPKNSVRSTAIELLNKINPDKYAMMFYRLLNDPSYYVAGSALEAFLEGNHGMDKEAVVKRFEHENNIRILVPLADYFTRNAVPDKDLWFQKKVEALQGESLYYFIGYYGDYFVKVKQSNQTMAIDKLYDLAKNHQAYYIRLGAFQSLFGFIDKKGIPEKVKNLYESETNELVKRYQEFYLDI